VLSLTGPLSTAGIPEREGILLAQRVVNNTGGIGGRPLQVVIEDDASNAETAIAKLHALLPGKVEVILGGTGLSATVAMGQITAARKILQVSFTGLGAPIETERKCVFHLTPAQDLNARSLLEYARRAGFRRLGVLHDTGFGQSVATHLQSLSSEYALSLVAIEKFEVGATDVSTQVARIRHATTDAVLVVTQNPAVFKQLRNAGAKVPVVATHVSAPYAAVRAMGEGVEGVVFADFLVAEDPSPHQLFFVTMFGLQYKRAPKNFEAAGYDSVMLVAEAYRRAGQDATGERLCAASRRPFQGTLARYDFGAADMGGLTPASFTYSTWSKGGFVRVKPKADAEGPPVRR
jgi:branched-chain amino acid transport system substrate-binding protein